MRVHLWAGPVAEMAAAALAMGLDWLSPGEKARAAAMLAPRRRAQFLAGHWLARQMLAAVHGGDAQSDWALSAERDGPPEVTCRNERATSASRARVALTHSAGWLACAVSDGPVGLDLEVPQRRRDWAALAEVACTPRERRRLSALPPELQSAHFYAIWTLKEAWFKQRCKGIEINRLRWLETDDLPGPRCEARVWQASGFALALVASHETRVDTLKGTAWLPEPQPWTVGPRLRA